MNMVNTAEVNSEGNPVREFERLWREYGDAQTEGLNALRDSLMKPWDAFSEDSPQASLENPLQGKQVQDKLKNWQDAVWGGSASNVFREEARSLCILDPRPR